jgi:hypothetical protein
MRVPLARPLGRDGLGLLTPPAQVSTLQNPAVLRRGPCFPESDDEYVVYEGQCVCESRVC